MPLINYKVTYEKAPVSMIGDVKPLTYINSIKKVEKMITYTWEDGTSFTGILKDLKIVSAHLNKPLVFNNTDKRPSGFYYSTTHGLTDIKSMNSKHIKNTIVKMTKEHYTTLAPDKLFNITDYTQEFLEWINSNSLLQELFKELELRGV